jgi:hypothetical protein
MRTCAKCGVIVEDDSATCPLCGHRMGDSVPSVTATEESTGIQHGRGAGDGPPLAASTVRSAKLWLFEIVSLVMFTAAIVVFAADFAYGFSVSWSRFPLVCIVFCWAAGSLMIVFWKHPTLLLVAETVTVSVFLYVLSLFSGSTDWFLPLALPITVLVALVYGTGFGLVARLRLTMFQAIGVVFLSSGLFIVALEAVISVWVDSDSLVSWSLVVFACALSLFFLMLFLNRRLKERHAEYRRIFHI